MGALVIANRRVVVVSRQTWLEAIHRGNMAKKRVMPNSSANELFFGKDADGRFKPIPDEILDSSPFYTGTIGVVGNQGSSLGHLVESQCEYAGSMKTVVVKPDRGQAALVDTALLCDHGFAPNGNPFLAAVNASTEKPIRTHEEIGEADTILLSLNGQTRTFKIQSRAGGVLEVVGDENTRSWISDCANISLVRRGYLGFGGIHGVGLYVGSSERLDVIIEISEAGAHLEAAARLVEQLN